jgi:hypothetical protein
LYLKELVYDIIQLNQLCLGNTLMAQIQITDLNPSDSASMEELTDEELLEINGGSLWTWLTGSALIVVGALTTPVGIGVGLIAAGATIIASDSESFAP